MNFAWSDMEVRFFVCGQYINTTYIPMGMALVLNANVVSEGQLMLDEILGKRAGALEGNADEIVGSVIDACLAKLLPADSDSGV